MQILKTLYKQLNGKDVALFGVAQKPFTRRKKALKWLKRLRRLKLADRPNSNTEREIAEYRAYYIAKKYPHLIT